MQLTLDNIQLQFCKYEEIEHKNPQFKGQTYLLDGNHYVIFWFVQQDNKYYGCIGQNINNKSSIR